MIKFLIITIFFFHHFSFADVNDANYIIDYENYTAYKPNKQRKGNLNEGRQLFISRKVNCLSCHQAPIKNEKFQGNFGPILHGVGSKYTKEQLRLILINPKIFNENTIMPAYFKKVNYFRTPDKFKNKTILSMNEVEDLVEYLYSLK